MSSNSTNSGDQTLALKQSASRVNASGRAARLRGGPIQLAFRSPVVPKVMVIINTSFGDADSLLCGIARFQRERGAWEVFVDNDTTAKSDPRWLSDQTWNGVISRTTSPALVDFCLERNLPLVDLNDCPAFEGVPKIRPDNVSVGHMVAEDIYERGYRRLYYCGYSDQDWSNERCDGFREALRLLDCEAHEFLLPTFCRTPSPSDNAATIAELATWLATLPAPAGVMAAHDVLGRQILAAAQQIGRLVPDDLAVVGVNNEEVRCELASPTLSSVALDNQRAGYVAAEELARLMSGLPAGATEVRIDPLKIVTRSSTDGLAIEDRAISAAIAIIRREACKGITVEDVVRRALIPRARLERGFRFFLGRSPQAEIRRIRLGHIKQLLTETDYPLKEIAVLTGFEHVEYMNVCFKRDVGETPGRFRRAAQNVVADRSNKTKPMAVAV